jgi:DME family drug/metabolite transporter
VTGCGLLAVAGQPVRFSPVGVTLAVVAGAAYAVYTVAAKELLAGHGQVQVMAVLFGGGRCCWSRWRPCTRSAG